MSELLLSATGQQCVAAGREPSEVWVAEMLLGIYRTLRICVLMEESGHREWEGFTQDELDALLKADSDALGLVPGDPDSEAAIKRFIAFRVERLRKMPYTDYLQTPEWKDVRRFALWRAGDRCQTCNAKSRLQVHHRTYDQRGHESLDDVTVLCGDCHSAFHHNRRLSPR